MVTKEEVNKEMHNLEELRRTTIRVFKRRNLKVFATIAGRTVDPIKSMSRGALPFHEKALKEEIESNIYIYIYIQLPSFKQYRFLV